MCNISVSFSLLGNELYVTQTVNQHDYLYTGLTDMVDTEVNSDGNIGKLNIANLGKGWTKHEEERRKYLRKELYVDAETQTEMSGHDIDRLLNEHSQLTDKLNDKDTLRRELFIEKVTESDESVSRYTGFPSCHFLNSFFNVLDKKETKLKYWSESRSGQEKNYQRQQKQKTGPKRKLKRYDEYILT